MKVVAIVQARMGSIRLPNKVMKTIGTIPMIEILLKRLNNSKLLDQIILATSTDIINKPLIGHVESLGFICEQGSEVDVLERYVQAAEQSKADVIVRITGDCPLIDPVLVDECIRKFQETKVDYCSNTIPPTFPDGLDIEVFKFSALKKAAKESTKLYYREHVTPYFREFDIFSKANYSNKKDLSPLRWTVDEPEDFEVISKVFDHFKPDIYFGWKEVLALYNKQPELFATNSKIQRNQGAIMKTGQKLWKRAKKIIPGGNMLLSKRSEMFLPDHWPNYFSKAKGCKVWDLDNNEYIDMSIMGIGTNILGYGNLEVDEAVRKVVQSGNMSTLNCPEEVYLAEKLVDLHKWSDMVRFARSGGEANAIAIRIARAASGRDKVAVCGYHGWHDWYLSANLGNNKILDGHLLPGLEPKGVPLNLKGSVFPFNYNRFDELEALVKTHDIGVIKMEVERSKGPEDNFLNKVRQLATEREIVLIFDECTSGFRETFGGIHKKYSVEPDMAMFGKALGNGYAITAIIGRREIMEAAQSTFISSTFWTERIGPSAALKTLEIMEREKSWNKITKIGKEIRERLQKLSNKYQIKMSQSGIPALTTFKFQSDNSLAYKTLITQEMLKKGYLAGNSIYVCVEHSPEIIEGYFDALDPIFGLISECENGRDIKELLEGPICHGDFKRLN
jgi:glutamate-1-semialdehyde 2,1-aminomutase